MKSLCLAETIPSMHAVRYLLDFENLPWTILDRLSKPRCLSKHNATLLYGLVRLAKLAHAAIHAAVNVTFPYLCGSQSEYGREPNDLMMCQGIECVFFDVYTFGNSGRALLILKWRERAQWGSISTEDPILFSTSFTSCYYRLSSEDEEW